MEAHGRAEGSSSPDWELAGAVLWCTVFWTAIAIGLLAGDLLGAALWCTVLWSAMVFGFVTRDLF